MALPQDFWQNEHMFHRFRSKPCQRLLRSGICEWHSQCQFSHDVEWPRRPPSKHNYSPALCPHIRPVMNNSGEVQLENTCPNGLSCRYSHTKDEVLYHPSMFKTSLCEEHRSLTSDQRSARRSKHRPRCHRYYCPFAHGKQELRTSPLTPEQRESLVGAIGIFAHGGCCGICTNNQIGPGMAMPMGSMDDSSGMGYGSTMPMVHEASIQQSQLWAGATQSSDMNSMLSQMVLPGGSAETTLDITEERPWGVSPWLQQQQPQQQQQQQQHQQQQQQQQPQQQQQQQQEQQPSLLQQQAGGFHSASAIKAMQGLTVSKEALQPQMLNVQAEQVQQEAEAHDGELDLESEIYDRAVRFLDELSTEESDGSEPEHIAMNNKEANIQLTQPVKEFDLGALPPDWNPQEAWVADVNGQDPWQVDVGMHYWNMPSMSRIV